MSGVGLTETSRRMLKGWPVRKSRGQKAAFRQELCRELKALGWQTQVESSAGVVKSHNVVAGDPESAKLVLCAHYDTPARLFMPNVVFPRSLPLMLAYQLLLVVPMVIALFVVNGLLVALGLRMLVFASSLLVLGAFMWLIMAGPANKSNVNDNTSGVLTLLEVAAALPPADRHKVALVFFDNEELGLLGSMAFRRRHGDMRGKLLLNFDCVADGDTLMLMGTRLRDKKLCALLEQCFMAGEGKQMRLDASPFTFYPSDQANFKGALCGAAFHTKPFIGPMLGRIHTGRDTRLDEENLAVWCTGCVRLAGRL